MKEVYKLPENDRKILSELLNNPEGLRVKTLIKLTNLKQRTVYKRLNLLKDRELIEKISPMWKISNGQSQKCAKLLGDSNIFELHNLSYVVKLLKVPDWWSKRKNYLIRLKEWQFKEVNFGKANSNPYVQLLNENFVIQCYPESLIIIARKRYYENNPYQTSIKAISDILDLLDWFCERFRFDFWCNGVPHLQVRNNDFNRLNDALANHVKMEGTKFLVKIDERRKVYVDMSEPFGKEANYPEGQEKLEKVTRDYLTKDVLLPSEIQQLVGKNAEHLNYYAKHLESHVEAIRTLSKTVSELRKEIKRLRD
jgi:hypothetical protein